MSSRIVIPTSGGGGRDTTPPASAYDLDQKIRAAVVCGVCVAGIVFVAASIICLPGGFWREWVRYGIPASVVAGLLVACVLGIWWAWVVARRAFLVDDLERERRWRLEDEARKAQEAAAARAKENIRRGPMDHDDNPETLTLEQELNLVAWEMLARVTLGRGKPTREAMEGDGVCSQQEWNLVNGAMQAIGLRKGYTWQAATFEQAWDTWRANFRVQVDGDGATYAWAMRPGGRWKVVERVA